VSQEVFRDSMTSLITRAQAVAPVLMLSGFPFDETRTSPYAGTESFYLLADAEVYTELLRSVCRESSVPLLDYFALWSARDTANLLAEDGLHANAAGHQLLFEQLRDFFTVEYT